MTVFRSLSNAVKSNQQFQRLQNAYKDAMGYRRVGLFRDDLIIEEDTVKEALRRLTPQQYQDRTFRFRRALNLSTQQSELPKELWTKPEEDIPYLTPIINQVHSEVYSAQEFEFLNTVPAELAKRNRA